MTEYDWLLIFFGGGLAVFLTTQRFLRSVFALVILWLATFASALLYQEAAFRTQAVTGSNLVLVEGLMFDGLLVIFFIAGFVLLKVAFPVTTLPKIGFLDYVGAFLVAIIVAALVIALIGNSLGVMVREQWPDNREGWTSLQWRVSRSGLRSFVHQVLSIYGWAFVPFFPGLPPVLIAQ